MLVRNLSALLIAPAAACRCLFAALLLAVMAGCAGLPAGTSAVDDFSLDRYAGVWYEIARLDHRFERGLDCVSATYSRHDDGGVRVINRGVNLETGEASRVEGRGYFVDDADTARLKVSFFGPFYGGYNVLALDDDYRHALVAGSDRGYLWLLARTPSVSEAVRTSMIHRAATLGFPVDELINVDQGPACAAYRETSAAEPR